jgi:hypothetical protein
MKLLSGIKLVTIATIALTLFVLPNFAQDTPESTPTPSTPTPSTPTQSTPTPSTPTPSTPTQSTPTPSTPTQSTPTQSTSTAEPSSSTFPDISDDPYKAEIEEAAKLGIVKGFPDGTFKPDETVSREQAAVMIVQAINSKVPVDLNEKPKSLFWMYPPIAGAPKRFTGCSGIFTQQTYLSLRGIFDLRIPLPEWS